MDDSAPLAKKPRLEVPEAKAEETAAKCPTCDCRVYFNESKTECGKCHKNYCDLCLYNCENEECQMLNNPPGICAICIDKYGYIKRYRCGVMCCSHCKSDDHNRQNCMDLEKCFGKGKVNSRGKYVGVKSSMRKPERVRSSDVIAKCEEV
jgi:hypothetical protein